MRCSMRSLASFGAPIALQRVFVINLDRRPDRWAAITDVCRRAGLTAYPLERVAAVDGATVNVDVAFQRGFISRLGRLRLGEPSEHRIWGMDLNAGALGCALSHLQLWSRIAALPQFVPCADASTASCSAKSCYLVLEDDAELCETDASVRGNKHHANHSPSLSHQQDGAAGFLQRLESRMRRVPADWELTYVGGLDTAGQCADMAVADGVARVPQYHRTTSAYLVTANGARRLLATCVPLTFQLDTVMTMKVGVPPGLPPAPGAVPYVLDPVSYTLQPPLMRQAAELGTDIQQHAK